MKAVTLSNLRHSAEQEFIRSSIKYMAHMNGEATKALILNTFHLKRSNFSSLKSVIKRELFKVSFLLPFKTDSKRLKERIISLFSNNFFYN